MKPWLTRRALPALLTITMITGMNGVPVYAAVGSEGTENAVSEGGLCEHHPEHTEDCGYVEGQPCAYENGTDDNGDAIQSSQNSQSSQSSENNQGHTDDCYRTVKSCTHIHTASCYPDDMEEASSSEAREPENCSHVCGEDSGCIKTVLICQEDHALEDSEAADETEDADDENRVLNHVHDEACGYVEAQPCTYVCSICAMQEDSTVSDTEGEKKITAWTWVEADGFEGMLDEENLLPLIGVSEQNPVDLDTLLTVLPVAIRAQIQGEEELETEELISLDGSWHCDDFPEEGAGSGSYLFEAELPEGYVMEEEAGELCVTVELGGAQLYESASVSGWNEDHTVYTVIGTKGYPVSYQKISLDDGATLDLSQADDSNVSGYTTLFTADGDLTIIGDGESIRFGGQTIVQMTKDATLTLKDFCWEYSGNNSTGAPSILAEAGIHVTIKYEGDTELPVLNLADSNSKGSTLTFEPNKDGESLSLGGVYMNSQYSDDFSVIFDGGTVEIANYVMATNIAIKNDCDITGGGSKFSGIHYVSKSGETSGSITITGSSVDLSCEDRYNGNQTIPAIGGSISPSSAAESWYKTLLESGTEGNGSKIEITDSKVTVNTDDVAYGGIGCAEEITICGSKVEVSSAWTDTNVSCGYMAGIGGMFRTITIEDSEVVSDAYQGAGIGTGNGGLNGWEAEDLSAIQGSIVISDSRVEASSVQSAGIGTSYVGNYSTGYRPQPMEVIVEGNSDVEARSVNGAGIGGGRNKASISDPEQVEIKPENPESWESVESGTAGTYSLRRSSASASVKDSSAPDTVSNYVISDGQSLTVRSGDSVPSILAESGVCAIACESVDTDVTMVQNTTKLAAVSASVIALGENRLGTLREDFKSIAVTLPECSAGIYGMTSGTDSMANWNEETSPLYGTEFQVEEDTFNRFWAEPQKKLGGTVYLAKSKTSYTQISSAEAGTTMYVRLNQLTPSSAGKTSPVPDKLTYQWYKDGTALEAAVEAYYWARQPGVYYCVVSGENLYYGSVTSNAVTIYENGSAAPSAPEADSIGTDSITVKAPDEQDPDDRQDYEYSIDGGASWQDDRLFSGLSQNTVYSIIRRVKDTGEVQGTVTPGPASAPLTVRTASEKLDEETVQAAVLEAIDYERECLDATKLPEGITFYTTQNTSASYKLDAALDGCLTPYIAGYGETEKSIYAKVEGSSQWIAVVIPSRPAAPSLTASEIAAAAAVITVAGQNGVEYNYAVSGQTPSASTSQLCTDGTVSFGGLSADTEYVISARWPASNEEKRFHSGQVNVKQKTLAAGQIVTTSAPMERFHLAG